jgi:hypothetical protein
MDIVVKIAKKGNKSNKNRKYGRNKVKCAAYKAAGRREKNKARKMAKRVRKLEKSRLRKAV